MEPSLFADFPKTDKPTWRGQLEKELKDRSYEDVLRQVTNSVAVDPYYVAEDLVEHPDYRQIQASQKKTPGWLTVPFVSLGTPTDANQSIRRQLERGADAVWVDCGEASLAHLDLSKTLHTIRLTDTPVFLDTPESAPEIIKVLTQGSSYYLKGGLVHDPLATWMRSGQNYHAAFDAIAEGLALTKAMREFHSYKIESHIFHEAGADTVQELAYTLASFVTCMDELTEREVSPLLAANRFVFSVSVGTEYLTEIAKLRALRYLYQKITRAYDLPDELCQPFIQAQSSRLYQSAYSPHTNIVRHTAEAMSAAMGGCDALSTLPYDAEFAEAESEFSERVARNISLVLKNESYLDKVTDPAAGSYYIEMLTLKLAEAVWDLFLQIEQEGGLAKAFEESIIQNSLEHSWNARMTAYQNGKVMVGVNKYREKAEQPIFDGRSESENISPNWEFALLKKRSLEEIAPITH
ncbi:methylmalonyl-CoA mutase family protein [Persicitalea sp.]|uniref:methylmalonyl-CoA mutase family protein n=1 Tax=Persicitalea sp. TaxID=3100273 RepID=UPI003593628D